jgi:hypothetical protein
MGLVIGLVVGAGGMYVALRPPWASHDTAPAQVDQVAEAPTGDAGVGKPKKKKRAGGARRPNTGGGGSFAGGEDEDWASSGGGGEETEPPRLVQLSAADRSLEWRGDDTSPGKTTLDMGNNAEARSLENGEIQSVISSQSGPVQACVVKAAANTDLSGTFTVKMVVEGNGRVARARLHAPRYMFSQGVLVCVQGAVKAMKFPATGAATLVTLPVNLTVNR